jgi:hypothetical protein
MTETNLTGINSPQLPRELYLQTAVVRKTAGNTQTLSLSWHRHWLI